MTVKTIEVSILKRGNICAIPVPFDPKSVFGKVRAPVRVTINGYVFRSTIARMGGLTFIPLRKSNQEAASVAGGDRVRVRIAADIDERVVDVPVDLAKALDTDPDLWTTWQALSFTHRRECAESVRSAIRPETRERRVARAIEFVTARRAAMLKAQR